MPCYEKGKQPAGMEPVNGSTYATLEDCEKACPVGACCTGDVCAVKMECECDGPGERFMGEGTTCDPNPCGENPLP